MLIVPSVSAQPFISTSVASEPVEHPSRTRVVVLVRETLAEAESSTFLRMLRAELASKHLQTSILEVTGSVRSAVEAQQRRADTLMIAVVARHSAATWRVTIVDAARGRAISRDVAPGVEADAAVLEALTSIVSSAAAALLEGLEIASRPVPEVLEAPPAASETSPALARPRAEAEPRAEARAASPGIRWRATLASSIASFDRKEPVTTGVAAEVGVTLPGNVTPRLSLATHLPVEVDTELGAFRLHRMLAGISVGRTLTLGAFELELQTGLLGERLERSRAESREDVNQAPVATLEDRAAYRVGPELGARARYQLLTFLALEWTAALAYFTRPVRFVTVTQEKSVVAAPWQLVGFMQFGLELRAP